MALKEELTDLLSNPASGIQTPEFDLEEGPNGNVGGFVISPTFAGKSQIERQNMIWDFLDANLDQEKIRHIVSLVTITPEEGEED